MAENWSAGFQSFSIFFNHFQSFLIIFNLFCDDGKTVKLLFLKNSKE